MRSVLIFYYNMIIIFHFDYKKYIAAPPRFTVKPSDASVPKGTPTALDCAAGGVPSPLVLWTVGSGVYSPRETPSVNASDIWVNSQGTLVFNKVIFSLLATFKGCV